MSNGITNNEENIQTLHSTTNEHTANKNKYTVTIDGLTLTFASSHEITLDNLNTYLQTNLSASQLLALAKNQEQISVTRDTETVNISFVELVERATSLLTSYTSQNENHLSLSPLFGPQTKRDPPSLTPPLVPSTTSSSSSTNSYTFKIPSKETAFDKYWKEHYDALTAFKERYGHCTVSRTTPGYTQLGNWLTDQRRKLRGGKLTRQQFEMLNELGVEWDRNNTHVGNMIIDGKLPQ